MVLIMGLGSELREWDLAVLCMALGDLGQAMLAGV